MPYKNKEDRKKYAKKHYQQNKDVYKKRSSDGLKKARKRNREFVDNYLKNNPCVDCGESDIIVLEFDHVKDEKIKNIANAIRDGWSTDKIKKEIEKCEVRCANCHRRVTHKRRIAV